MLKVGSALRAFLVRMHWQLTLGTKEDRGASATGPSILALAQRFVDGYRQSIQEAFNGER